MECWLDAAFQKLSNADSKINSDEELDWKSEKAQITINEDLLKLGATPPQYHFYRTRKAAVDAQKKVLNKKKKKR